MPSAGSSLHLFRTILYVTDNACLYLFFYLLYVWFFYLPSIPVKVKEVLWDTASFSTKAPLAHAVATSGAITVSTTTTLENSTINVFTEDAL